MDDAAGSLEALLELGERLGPAEKPPKGTGRRQVDDAADRGRPDEDKGRGTRRAGHVARRHPAAAERLEPADVLVDGMRGPSSIWYRIRINLQHVPKDQRPPQEELIADYNPWMSRLREDQ